MLTVERVKTEFSVTPNTIALEYSPAITGLKSGGFVLAWTKANKAGINAQIFSEDGAPVGGEVLVTSQVRPGHLHPSITELTNGDFVVTWQVPFDGVSSKWGVIAQIFSVEGSKIGSEFQVGSESSIPTVTGLKSGGFVVSWVDFSDYLGDLPLFNQGMPTVRAQMFSADGTKIGNELLVNTLVPDSGDPLNPPVQNYQDNPNITGLKNGGFVVIWNDGASLAMQVFGADGSKVGGEYLVSPTYQAPAAPITALTNGGFVISWTDKSNSLGDTSGSGVRAQVFAADGTKVGSEFLVNTQTTNDQSVSTITALANGGFVVSWQDRSGTVPVGDTSGINIKAQVFSADGTKLGEEFLVNTETDGSQLDPTVTGLSNGGFVISWSVYDASGRSIKAQVFSMFETFTGTAIGDTLTGTAFGDVFQGLGGIDTIDGKGGSDVYIIKNSSEHLSAEVHDSGKTGTDEVRFSAGKSSTLSIFAGDAGLETVVVGAGTGLTADSSGVIALNIDAAAAPNALTLVGNAGANMLTGTAFNDTIKGGAGNDKLDGGVGIDKMFGGAGNDIYYVDSAGDHVYETATASSTDMIDLGGKDTVSSSIAYTLGKFVENLTLTGSGNLGGNGNDLANTILGNDGANILRGLAGNDLLSGGAGNDRLIGGTGRDRLTGGTGADSFVFDDGDFGGRTTTSADRIVDFSQAEGDRIDLKLVDANTANGTTDNAFTFIGTKAFSKVAGELRYTQSSGNTLVLGDTDGNGTADFMIRLDGLHTLVSSDFVL